MFAISFLAVAETIASTDCAWVALVKYQDGIPDYTLTVTHPSTNPAWHRATTLIETNMMLPLSHTAT